MGNERAFGILFLSFSPPRPPRPPKGTQVRPRPQNDSKMSPNGPQNAPKCSHFGPLSASFFAMLSPVASPKEKPSKKIGARSVLFFVKKAERSAGRVPARRTVGPPLEKNGGRFPLFFGKKRQLTCCCYLLHLSHVDRLRGHITKKKILPC